MISIVIQGLFDRKWDPPTERSLLDKLVWT